MSKKIEGFFSALCGAALMIFVFMCVGVATSPPPKTQPTNAVPGPSPGPVVPPRPPFGSKTIDPKGQLMDPNLFPEDNPPTPHPLPGSDKTAKKTVGSPKLTPPPPVPHPGLDDPKRPPLPDRTP